MTADSASAVRRVSLTAGYYAAFVALGLVSASLGPTLPGLADQTRVQLSQISILFTARAAGYLTGSLLAGRIFDRVTGNPVLVTVLLMMAVAMIAVPTLPLLWLLGIVIFVLGVSEGTLDVGGNTLLIWLHRSRVEPYMNGLHFFFGVGAFVSPIVIDLAVQATGGIQWAYWLLGMSVVPVALWLLPLASPSSRSLDGDGSAHRTNHVLIGLAALFMFLYVGAEVSFGGWIFTYAVALDLADASAARYLTSVFWGSLTIGRLVAIPIAARVRPRTVLIVDLAGSLLSVALILMWPDIPAVAWGGAIGLGFFMASIFPTVINWVERRVTLTGNATSWFFVGASLGSMSIPWLIGQLFDARGPQVTMTTIFVTLVLASGLFVVLMAYGGPARSDEV